MTYYPKIVKIVINTFKIKNKLHLLYIFNSSRPNESNKLVNISEIVLSERNLSTSLDPTQETVNNDFDFFIRCKITEIRRGSRRKNPECYDNSVCGVFHFKNKFPSKNKKTILNKNNYKRYVY